MGSCVIKVENRGFRSYGTKLKILPHQSQFLELTGRYAALYVFKMILNGTIWVTGHLT